MAVSRLWINFDPKRRNACTTTFGSCVICSGSDNSGVTKMDKKSFLQAGHTPTLFAAFLYFDLSFMVWVLLGPLGVQIARDLALTSAQKGLMVATPVLAGALLRILMGLLVDHLKPKKAGLIGQVMVIAALAYAWFHGIHSFEQSLILGLFLLSLIHI